MTYVLKNKEYIYNFDVIRFGLGLEPLNKIPRSDDSANLDEGNLGILMYRIASAKYMTFLRATRLDSVDLLDFHQNNNILQSARFRVSASDGHWQAAIIFNTVLIDKLYTRHKLFLGLPALDIVTITADRVIYSPGYV
jgi:hypothetical protein